MLQCVCQNRQGLQISLILHFSLEIVKVGTNENRKGRSQTDDMWGRFDGANVFAKSLLSAIVQSQ